MLNNSGINKIFLLGTISNKPQRQVKCSESTFLYFTLETKEHIGGKIPLHIEHHNIEADQRLINQDVAAGQLLHIEGRIQTNSWVDHEQIRRYKTIIVAARVTIVEHALVTR